MLRLSKKSPNFVLSTGSAELIQRAASAVQSLKAAGFSTSVLDLQDQWRDRLAPARSDSAAFPLIDLLPQHPILTAAVAEKEIGRSRPATINGLEKLAEAGILVRHRNQKKGDSWEARELFKLLGDFERQAGLPG